MRPTLISRRIRLTTATLLLTTGLALQARADDAADAELKKLDGAWTAPSGNGGEVTYTFKKDKLTVVAPSREYKMTVKLDTKAKPDKTVDFKIDEGPDDAKGQTSKGIYKFDGEDKFIFCFRPMGDRPDKYETVGYEQIVVELKKKKK